MLDLAFQADRDGRAPVYRQLEAHLEGLIRAGRLAPGQKLPATRDLALTLGLSRNTVNQAYQGLAEAGLLHSHVGQGTFVSSRGAAGKEREVPAAVNGGFVWEGLFSRAAQGLVVPASLARAPQPASLRFDFRPGQVDPDLLPLRELRRCWSEALQDDLASLAGLPDPRGHAALRGQIARALVGRGIACNANEVLVLNGAQQALDLAARVLVDPGDTVVMEQPGYFGAAFAFRARQAHVLGVSVDDEGLRTDELARILRARRVKLVYTTPAVQCPTGVSLSDARRQALLDLTDSHQIPILEDDYDSELRLADPVLPALKTLDRNGQVLYVGTFSKALLPGLRLGYLVAPRELSRKAVVVRAAMDAASDGLTQAALARFLANGGLDRHVRRVRRHYARRLEILLDAVAGSFPSGTRVQRPAGGNALWVTLPRDVDPERLFGAAREAGLAYGSSGPFFLDGRDGEHLFLCFGRVKEEDIPRGIEALGRIVKRQLPRRRSR